MTEFMINSKTMALDEYSRDDLAWVSFVTFWVAYCANVQQILLWIDEQGFLDSELL